ncbi:MAG: hypothetical protein AAF849_07065 [Bacteroidota bacterium]
MSYQLFLTLFTIFFIGNTSFSQAGEVIPFDSERWTVESDSFILETHLGKSSLYLPKGGKIYLKDAEFLNGIIEYEVAFAEIRTFLGLMFRMQDVNNFEDFYLRPHQSGNPDANQYTPNFNGLAGWQLYHGKGFAQAIEYPFNEWIPIKCVVSGQSAEIYIGEVKTPTLFIPQLKRSQEMGMLGIRGGTGHFANFRYTKLEQVQLVNEAIQEAAIPVGTIASWEVSNTFSENDLKDITTLTEQQKKPLNWQTLQAESTGLANLASISKLEKERNTVFAKRTIEAEKAQIKPLAIGYSDRVKVYCNDQLLYGGNNGFRSRDYRYLGTIGYFDEVFLPLRQGKNEIWIAVSESFGGWGLQAKFEDIKGISIK